MQIEINDNFYEIGDDESRLLVWVLRDELGLTGTKFGCGKGICGSCTILVDGNPVRSCVTPVRAIIGKSVTTIEGLSKETADGEVLLHPVQQAFLETQTPQCSWCMSGQMMTAVALLDANPSPDLDEINQAMNFNYCRCGTYVRIREAVQLAAEIKQKEGSR